MNKKILNIWAIQNRKEELYSALSKIKTDDVVIFNNALINLKVNKHLITNIIFDTAIYSENSDILIIIKNNSPATFEDAIEYLNNKHFNYNLICFKERETHINNKPSKEVWFARSPENVASACNDTISKGLDKTYCFNKTTQAELQFGYFDKYNKIYGFDRTIYLKGIITLKDKKIFVVNNNIMYIDSKQEEMEKVLIKKGFKNTYTYHFEVN